MSKKEEFKEFAKQHPELVSYIKSGSNTWQDFYEIYDIYGSSDDAWKEYTAKEIKEVQRPTPIRPVASSTTTTTTNTTTGTNQAANTTASTGPMSTITNLFKKADMNSIQKHIGTAQKAIGLFQEITTKDVAAGAAGGVLGGLAAKGPSSPRPLNKFFED